MTSSERRERMALRAGDDSLREQIQGVDNAEDIRLANREDSWGLPNVEQIVRNGHPADREILRRQALERITDYAGSTRLSRYIPIYQAILERVDAAIVADARRHKYYLAQLIERDKRLIEKARSGEKRFVSIPHVEASIAKYEARIFEIALQELTKHESEAASLGIGTPASVAEEGVPTSLSLAYVPA